MLKVILISTIATISFAHEKQHGETKKPTVEAKPDTLKLINEEYLVNVKPIFEKKCFDCHGSTTKYPWYYKVPGAKQLIEHDISESKEHLDMSNDFPFKGHGEPKDDLEAIKKSVQNKSMPPFRYRILHGDSALSEEEVKIVDAWVSRGVQLLELPKK